LQHRHQMRFDTLLPEEVEMAAVNVAKLLKATLPR
jgi:hypothetical protein